MRFKTNREWVEWQAAIAELRTIVPVALLWDRLSREIGVDAMMTGVMRTRQEQLDLCQRFGWPRSRRSVHEFGRGIDFRSWIYHDADLVELIDSVNRVFKYGGRYKVAAVHSQGTANHVHLQVPGGRVWAM